MRLSELLQIFTNFSARGERLLSRKEVLEGKRPIPELARRIMKNPEARISKLGEGISGNTNIKVLSSRLKRMLLDGLFMLDLSAKNGFSDYALRFYRCEKDVFCARTLLMVGSRMYGAQLAAKALKEAQILERTELELELLGLLRRHSYYLGKRLEHQRYNARLLQVREVYVAEQAANFIFEEAMIPYVRSAQPSGESLGDAVEKLRVIFVEHQTFQLGMLYYALASNSSQTALDYPRAIQISKAAIQFISNRSLFSTPRNQLEFQLYILSAAVSSLKTKKATAAAAVCAELARVGSNNWFAVRENQLLLAMQMQEFSEGLAFASEVMEQARFAALPEHTKVRWQLFKEYGQYASGMQIKKRIVRRVGAVTKRSLFAPLANYQSDKAGLNFAAIVLQLLYLFEMRQYPALSERLDALRMYGKRYFQEYNQANTLMKILTVAAECKGDLTVLNAEIPALLHELSGHLARRGYTEGLHVIPYPILIPIFVDRLKKLEMREALISKKLKRKVKRQPIVAGAV